MSHAGVLLLVFTAILLSEKCFHAWEIAQDVEVKAPNYSEDIVDLQMLDNVGKRSSLFYAFIDDCVPQGSFCHYPYGFYYTCCENTGCFCNFLGFCTCKTYDAPEKKIDDPMSGEEYNVGTTNPIDD